MSSLALAATAAQDTVYPDLCVSEMAGKGIISCAWSLHGSILRSAVCSCHVNMIQHERMRYGVPRCCGTMGGLALN